jgi:hypothetical protein
MKEMCEKNWNCASKSIKILICQKSAKDGCDLLRRNLSLKNVSLWVLTSRFSATKLCGEEQTM